MGTAHKQNRYSLLPGVLANALAQAPPPLRFSLLLPLVNRIVRHLRLKGPIRTNLGMDSGFSMIYPEIRHTVQVFGRPKDYKGERGALALVEALGSRTDAFLDIGANIGYFTFLSAMKNPQTPVYYFEPNPDCFSLIESTVESNHWKQVHGFCVAIGKQPGQSHFYIDQSDSFLSSLDPKSVAPEKQRRIDTRVETLESFLDTHPELNHTIAKVDVENTEEDFLLGALSALSRVDFLIMEILLPAFRKNIISKVKAAGGYEAYYIDDYTLRPRTEKNFSYRAGQYNWLFCRKNPYDLRELLASSPLKVESSKGEWRSFKLPTFREAAVCPPADPVAKQTP